MGFLNIFSCWVTDKYLLNCVLVNKTFTPRVNKLFGGREGSITGLWIIKRPHLLNSKEFSLDSSASIYFLFFRGSRRPHKTVQRAACSPRAAVYPPLRYTNILEYSEYNYVLPIGYKNKCKLNLFKYYHKDVIMVWWRLQCNSYRRRK